MLNWTSRIFKFAQIKKDTQPNPNIFFKMYSRAKLKLTYWLIQYFKNHLYLNISNFEKFDKNICDFMLADQTNTNFVL